jgi:ribosome-binding protein aMBF1 (putative translation factor)
MSQLQTGWVGECLLCGSEIDNEDALISDDGDEGVCEDCIDEFDGNF